MYKMSYSFRPLVAKTFTFACGLTLTLLLLVSAAQGQAKATDGTTPSGVAPGAPAGSYALSGFENVNLFNGNLNFSLPLLKIGGRGNAQVPVTLTLNSVHWTVVNEGMQPGSQPFPFSHSYPSPIIDSSSGTPPSFGVAPEWWTGLRPGFGPGVLQGRVSRSMNRTTTLTRLTFTAADGTEYELRDVVNNGKPLSAAPRDRGTVFVSADGSSVIFVSNTAIQDVYNGDDGSFINLNGYLMMADGTRYDITTGLVRTISDRNGNRLSFTYDDTNSDLRKRRVLSITDSLGRQVLFAYDLQDSAGKYDRIKYSGFGGVERILKVRRTTLQAALRHTRSYDSQTTKLYSDLFPTIFNEGFGSTVNVTYNPDDVVSAVELPDGRSYQLFYNEYNELARVVLPTGGAIEYDYTAPSESVISSYCYQIHRRVTERRTYGDGGVLQTKQRYLPTYTETTSGGSSTWETKIEVELHDMVRDPAHTLVNVERHTFFGSPVPTMFKSGVDYSEWKEGKEKQIETLDAEGNLLRVVNNTWQQCTACEISISWWTNPAQSNHTADNAPSNNPHVIATLTTLKDVTPNQVSQQTFAHDKYNNLTDTWDYDYNPSVPANNPVRHSKTDYLTSNNSIDYTGNSIHICRLPSAQRVYAVNPTTGVETLAAKSEMIYDESIYQLNDYGTVTGWLAPATPARGNETTVRRWFDVASPASYIEAHVQYDQCGNVRKTWDGRGKVSEIEYSPTYNYALPTLTRTPVPGMPGTSGTAFETTSSYDLYTGGVISTTDANNQITTIEYNDVLDRPTKVVRPTGGGWTSFEYGDNIGNLYVRTQTSLDASRALDAYQYFDSLGRAWRTSQVEGADSILTDTQYDGLGRSWKISNPYRAGDSAQWSITSYDAQGRVTVLMTPDGAHMTNSYSGNTTTATDQDSKSRTSVTDALGRLVQVIEDPGGQLHYQTSYAYDALDNLRKVTQDAQKRYFLYDSLSRLIRSRNPEQDVNTGLNLSSDSLTDNNSQWSVAYSYDNNGNLQTQTDARGTTTTYAYDALNRVVARSYGGGTAVATPTVTYTYDTVGVANSKGRLTSISSSASTYNYTGYDALGRITASQQVTDGQSYPMSYTYDLAGNMTSQTYPTGRVVTNSFDGAGRFAMISGQRTGEAAKTYANSFGYAAHGAIQRMRLGNGKWEHTSFNSRLQTTEIGLGSSGTDSNLLKLQYDYGSTANNGTLRKQLIVVSGTSGFTATEHYKYDELNRVTGAQEVSGDSPSWQTAGTLWQQCFSYDRYGNRTINTTNTTSTLVGPNPTISGSTNRITPQSGEQYEYDLAGNLKTGQGGEAFAYDGDNKLAQYQGGATQTGGADYLYDGNGNRVKKVRPSETTIFVYNINEQLVAEYTSATPETNGTSYLINDNLGTPRVILKADGSVRARHDYLPFGEELYASTGNRSTGQGYNENLLPADKTRQKFTGYERDNETKLDFAKARYYSSLMGRFTSPDDFLNDTHPGEPQSWNLYAYVRNNPLSGTDPTGKVELNSDGTIRFVVNQENVTRQYGNDGVNRDNGHPIRVTGQVDAGWIFADDGTPIPAERSLGPLVVAEYDEKGNLIKTTPVSDSSLRTNDISTWTNTSNCTGTSLVGGEFWVQAANTMDLLGGEGYDIEHPVTTPQAGDIGVYTNSEGKIDHVVDVTKVNQSTGQVTQVESKGGVEPVKFLPPGPGRGTAWSGQSTLKYYRKTNPHPKPTKLELDKSPQKRPDI